MFPKPTTRENPRKQEQAEYREARVQYLKTHPFCEVGRTCLRTRDGRTYPGQATEVHHRRGRQGRRYLDDREWLAVCHACHAWIHNHPAWSYEHGYLLRRNHGEVEGRVLEDSGLDEA